MINIKSGNYVHGNIDTKEILGKVTYLNSDYIYINKIKYSLNADINLNKITKKEYDELLKQL